MATAGISGSTTITQGQLNRALLSRQHLLARSDMTASSMIAHLVGMQSQEPNDPYIGLWTRLDRFQPDDLGSLMLDRSAVRASLMRGTIHLVTAEDYPFLQPLMRPLHERVFPTLAHGRALDASRLPEILNAGCEVLAREPLTMKVLGQRLVERFPDLPPGPMAQAIRFLLPLVQIPPRGVWGKSMQATWALSEAWLGVPIPEASDIERMIERYLAAFGPATVADAQAWSGLTGLRQIFEAMRPRLRTFRNDRGQELFDIPDGELPDPDVPAPVRFLPGFENALLSHKDRTRIISEERRRAIGANNGLFQSTYLVDGMVAGTWMARATSELITMVVTPFERHDGAAIDALEDEGFGLLCLLAGGRERSVQFSEPMSAEEFTRIYR
jgi:hypothetical protein